LSSFLSGIINEARNAAGGVRDFATGLVSPTLRIGVTGLSRSGKTVFITALVHALLHGGKLPLFTALTVAASTASTWSRSPIMTCRASITRPTSRR
jgi:hypothetical protein